jgi:type IV pilus assembly protein PilC
MCMMKGQGTPKLDGRDAAFVMRVLSIARSRDMPLSGAVSAAADLDGLGQAQAFARHAEGMDDAQLLEALQEGLQRSSDSSSSHVLEVLRRTGLPADGLRELADWLNGRAQARHRMFSAISYPFTLTIVAAVVFSVVIHLFLMPILMQQFEALFDGLGGRIPLLTSVVIGIYGSAGGWLYHPATAAVYVLLVVAIAVALSYFALQFPKLRLSLYVPMARRYLYYETAASFCGSLALLLRYGTPADEALRLAAKVPANRVLGARLARLADRVEQGENLAECLRSEQALLPSTRWRLWSAYYRSELEAELGAVAEAAREEMKASELRIVNSAETVYGFLAAVVGFPIGVIVVAMYLPMFSLISQIG